MPIDEVDPGGLYAELQGNSGRELGAGSPSSEGPGVEDAMDVDVEMAVKVLMNDKAADEGDVDKLLGWISTRLKERLQKPSPPISSSSTTPEATTSMNADKGKARVHSKEDAIIKDLCSASSLVPKTDNMVAGKSGKNIDGNGSAKGAAQTATPFGSTEERKPKKKLGKKARKRLKKQRELQNTQRED
ncbi:hypothetical protein HDV00_004363 [Rhizophlyctis rosea]|nr:hypothetical protein HDV00_004363 [Rhizophlyctis rosea]